MKVQYGSACRWQGLSVDHSVLSPPTFQIWMWVCCAEPFPTLCLPFCRLCATCTLVEMQCLCLLLAFDRCRFHLPKMWGLMYHLLVLYYRSTLSSSWKTAFLWQCTCWCNGVIPLSYSPPGSEHIKRIGRYPNLLWILWMHSHRMPHQYQWTSIVEYQLHVVDDTSRVLMKQWAPDGEQSRATIEQYQLVSAVKLGHVHP